MWDWLCRLLGCEFYGLCGLTDPKSPLCRGSGEGCGRHREILANIKTKLDCVSNDVQMVKGKSK